MPSTFVTLTKEQFEAILPTGWREVGGERAQERIYDLPTDRPHLMIRVYSTVDKRTNVTRPHGADAIRIVFWDDLNDRPLGKGKKILRTEGRTSIEDRIASRLEEFKATARNQVIVDFDYAKAILKHETVAWMEFSQSLLEKLEQYGSLSDAQLAYVLGERNPKNKLTFEARVLGNDSHFKENYINGLFTQQENTHESQETHQPEIQEPAPVTPVAPPAQVVPVHTDPVPEIELDSLVDTGNYPHWRYGFPTFNPVQSTVLPRNGDDINVVISASTSAGKTICAEFYMDTTLAAGKTVIYMSPLKSLTQEKFTDWEVRFPDKKITILTGDYTLSEALKAELNDADIIVMTSEMVDSRTRRMLTEKNFWLKRVGLLIVDEAHILTTERGHAVETGIMRFTKINPEARVLLLSATMPNVDQLGTWLTQLNGKETQVFKSTWRPVQLTVNFLEYPIAYFSAGREDYWSNQQRKIALTVDTIMSKPEEKFLVFVHDKGTGRAIVKSLEERGERALFHNANLEMDERLEVEQDFANRNGGLRVLVSTSTLAWGRNLPARNVVIVGIHRGINQVDPLDFIQMAGRAGRYGYDDQGFVHFIVPEYTTREMQHLMENPRPIESVLCSKPILAFHLLAEIANREVKWRQDVFNWYSRSLAVMQDQNFEVDACEELLSDLEKMEMVTQRPETGFVQITNLGKVSAWLYYSPYDIHAWYKNFSRLFNTADTRLDNHAIAWAIGDVPSFDWGYIPKNLADECADFATSMRARGITVSQAAPYCVAALKCLDNEEVKKNPFAIPMRDLKYDILRIGQAVKLIDTMFAQWGKGAIWETLPYRIKYGVGEELVPFCRLPGIGAKRAKKIWDLGIHSLVAISRPENTERLTSIMQPAMVTRLQYAAKKILRTDAQVS